MNNGIGCPVDFVSINENKVRLVALLVLLVTFIYIWFGSWIIIAFLVADFLLRSVNLGKYSLLSISAGWLVTTLQIRNKPVDQAPKRFAARLGLTFTLIILIFHFLQLANAIITLALVLCTFAFMESFLGFCAGCYVYSFYIKLLRKPSFKTK